MLTKRHIKTERVYRGMDKITMEDNKMEYELTNKTNPKCKINYNGKCAGFPNFGFKICPGRCEDYTPEPVLWIKKDVI